MSIINEALAPCTKCGQQHKVTVYRSINISENPELKAKVAQSHSGQMKNPDTARRLKEMLDNLPEDVNVIVAVLKEKKVKN